MKEHNTENEGSTAVVWRSGTKNEESTNGGVPWSSRRSKYYLQGNEMQFPIQREKTTNSSCWQAAIHHTAITIDPTNTTKPDSNDGWMAGARNCGVPSNDPRDVHRRSSMNRNTHCNTEQSLNDLEIDTYHHDAPRNPNSSFHHRILSRCFFRSGH